MGKLACRVTIGIAACAAIVQLVSFFMPWYHMQMFAVTGVQNTSVEWDMHLWYVRVKMAQHNLAGGKLAPSATNIYTAAKKDNQVLFDCDGNRKCFDVKLHKVFQWANNSGTQYLQAILPRLPLFNQEGYALFFGGMVIMMLTIFSVLSLILGSIYLYYYSEVKSTKKSRKGALLFFGLAPLFGIINMLVSMVTLFITSSSHSGMFIWNLLTPKSGTLPVSGFWLSMCSLIVVMTSLCFSKFWKSARQERVREERKRIEKDTDMMRHLGLDSDDMNKSSSSSSSDSESESDMERGDRLKSARPYHATGNAGYAYQQPVFVTGSNVSVFEPTRGAQRPIVSYA